MLAQQGQQWPQSALLEDIVPTLWAVTGDVAKRPYSLLADIKNGGREQIDEFRDSVCLDHNLSVFGSTRGNVG